MVGCNTFQQYLTYLLLLFIFDLMSELFNICITANRLTESINFFIKGSINVFTKRKEIRAFCFWYSSW